MKYKANKVIACVTVASDKESNIANTNNHCVLKCEKYCGRFTKNCALLQGKGHGCLWKFQFQKQTLSQKYEFGWYEFRKLKLYF